MRNDQSSYATMGSSTADWTATSGMEDISYVNIPSTTISPALVVTTSPKHDAIGLDSAMASTEVCVNMKARDLPEDDEHRAPVDIVVALDVSSSMQGKKLDLCKQTLGLLLRVLYPKDRFGLVCYGSEVFIEIPAQKMTAANKEHCLEKINALKVRGMTNMSGAIGLALQELKQVEDPNVVQTVFLLTDGHANVGISNQSELLDFTRNCFCQENLSLDGTAGVEDQVRFANEKRTVEPDVATLEGNMVDISKSITFHCFGFGSDHNSELLTEMADVVAGGSYYFVENDANIGGAFGDALGGILSIVAQNVVVTITIPKENQELGCEVEDIYHENKVKRENGSYSVVIGDFYAEESRDLLFKVKLARAGNGEDAIPHALVTVSYTDTLQKIPVTNALVCSISRPIGHNVSEINTHVEVQLARLAALKAMAKANDMARNEDFSGAVKCLQATKATVRSSAMGKSGIAKTTLDGLDDDLEELEGGFASKSAYRSRGGHTYEKTRFSNTKQRAMHTEQEQAVRGSAATYRTTKKKNCHGTFS